MACDIGIVGAICKRHGVSLVFLKDTRVICYSREIYMFFYDIVFVI